MWPLLLATASAFTVTALPPLPGHPAANTSPQLRFDPTGTRLLSWSDDGVRIWSNTGSEIRFIEGRASTAASDERMKTLLVGYEGRIERIDADTGETVQRFPLGWSWVGEISIDPGGHWLVAADSAAERAVRYAIEGGAELELPDDARLGTPRAVSPSGVLHFVDPEGRLRTWDPSTGDSSIDPRPGLVARVDFSAGGGWMALAAWDWPIEKARRNKRGASTPQPWRQGWVRVRGPSGEDRQFEQSGCDIAISPRGRWIALSVDSEIRLLDGATGDVVGTLDAGTTACSLDWGADDVLAVGTAGGSIKRWRVSP